MRHLNWKNRLEQYLADQSKTDFVWGESDCCHFVAGAAKAMTGSPVAADIQCDSIVSALKVFIEHGRDVGQLADKYFKRINPAAAAYGDIVAVKVCVNASEAAFGDVSLGVFLGDSVVVKTQRGLLRLNPVFIAAWSVD